MCRIVLFFSAFLEPENHCPDKLQLTVMHLETWSTSPVLARLFTTVQDNGHRKETVHRLTGPGAPRPSLFFTGVPSSDQWFSNLAPHCHHLGSFTRPLLPTLCFIPPKPESLEGVQASVTFWSRVSEAGSSSSGSQKECFPLSASPGNLFKMQILEPHPDL